MARFGNQGLDHVAIGVEDVERSRRFYADVLGLERAHSEWDVPVVMAANGTGVAIFDKGLHPGDGDGQPDVRILHIAFRVDREGFERARAELAESGLEPRFSDHGISHSIYFSDPDGHQLELTTYESEMAAEVGSDEAFARVAARVRELLSGYRPPEFGHVPDADAALFLCAVDHKSGYERSHEVDGEGPLRGSALMWAVGLRTARDRGGGWLTAPALAEVSGAEVAEAFRIGGETVRDPQRRASLWRGLAAGLIRDHDGSAGALNAAAGGRLGGEHGLLALLGRYEAFADPLAKKAQLYAKICERRGWVTVGDPEHWEVSADSVLMRLALRSGLVLPGELEQVRAATREAFRRVAREAELSPPGLDDMLWELGREDADLLGREGGDLREPPRDPGSAYY